MNQHSNLGRNQSPQFNLNKLMKPGMFSDQSKLSKLKKNNEPIQKLTPQLIPQSTLMEENDVLISSKSKSQPKILQEKGRGLRLNSANQKPLVPQIPQNSNSPAKLSPQHTHPTLQNNQIQSPDQKEDQLVQLVTISQKLAVELESFDEFVSGNGVGYHQIESWVNEMKEKLKLVHSNIINIKQSIKLKSSNVVQDKSPEKSQVVNEQQIDNYLDQINHAKETGGSQEIITAMQNGILIKLQQELQEEKKQRFQIEEEASNVINMQEQEIQKLEQKIRNLEQGNT